MMEPGYRLSDFDYALPPELIAQTPLRERTASRLLHVDGPHLADLQFPDLLRFLRSGDLLVFNDTRVIKSRLHGHKASGGRVELLLERILGVHDAVFQFRASHPPRAGSTVLLPGNVKAEVVDRRDRFVRLRIEGVKSLVDYLAREGEVPLPRYITRAPDADDEARYQTVYARDPGAIAAPTAGLHFDQAMLAAVSEIGATTAYLTLHVGAGTFAPVEREDLSQHRMHSEWYCIPGETAAAVQLARERGGRIVAVGTTTLRALESAARDYGSVSSGEGETALFITPGFPFKVVDRLLTNFHLPRSTLLMLVSAFAGHDAIHAAYAHAVEKRYRFFSYGDAMLLERG